MALNELQQVKELLNRAKNVLIAFPAGNGGDAIGSALALALGLEKMKKRVDIIATGFSLPSMFKFLPTAKRIMGEVMSLRKFIITLNLEHTKLKDLSYSVNDNKLDIFLTPERGSFSQNDVTTRASEFVYDLIITVDTTDFNALGELFHRNTEFFYQTTVLNIDHSPANENFGQVNIVDINTPSSAEIVLSILEYVDPSVVDADIATCLFTGLTTATKSFSSTLVVPSTLERAAKLVTLGARREEVVTNLYRTKQLGTLKLWGRVLARLKSDSSRKLVWSVLQPDDFVKAGATEDNLPGVVEELISTAPEAGTVALIYEPTLGESRVVLHAGAGQHALDLLKPFEAEGDKKIAHGKLPGKSVLEAEKLIVERLKQLIRPLE